MLSLEKNLIAISCHMYYAAHSEKFFILTKEKLSFHHVSRQRNMEIFKKCRRTADRITTLYWQHFTDSAS